MSTPRSESGALKGRFEVGQSIGDRYRIVSSWGAGRLDEAYRVEDLQRDELVVLKVLRRTAEPIRPSRELTRLVSRLAKLRHPNVARVFELSVHVNTDPVDGDQWILFVTSELIEGETLGSFIRNANPLEDGVASSLIDGISSGLAAAHDKKIVHGNLSSAAIVLRADGESLNPVITDFALAVSGSEAHVPSIISPVYKAPETIVGRPSDQLSDVFSLGAVLYEILSGRIPFTGGNLLALDFRHLEETPRPLSDVVENIDPRLEQVVARCLSHGPEDRYANAGQVRHAIAGSEFWTPRTRRNVTTLGAAAALVVVMFGGSALLDRISELEQRRLTMLETTTYRPSFAILDLASADDAEIWIAPAISELIRNDISQIESVRVADDHLVRQLSGLTSSVGGVLDTELSARIRSLFDVEAIVIGTCAFDRTSDIPVVAVDICVIDARNGETLAAAFERGTPQSLPELATRTAARLLVSLGVNNPPSARNQWDPDAVRPWGEAILHERRHRFREALERLEEAESVQPENPQIQDALARVWYETGSASRAAKAARRAIDASRSMTPEESLERNARLAFLEDHPQDAVETRLRLARAFPDRVEHSYHLIDLLLRVGASRGVAEEIQRLRMSRSTLDPRTELAEARLQTQLGRFETARFHAERAADLAEAAGDSVKAEALIERARADASMGNTKSAWTDLLEAEQLMSSADDLSGLTKIDTIRATLLRQRGGLEAAMAAYDRLGERCRVAGQEQAYATALVSQAMIRSQQGRHHEATLLLESTTALFRNLDDEANLSRALCYSADVLLSLGKLAEARDGFSTAARTAREGNLRGWEGFAHAGMARVAIERLDLDEAAKQSREARASFGDSPPGEATAEIEIIESELDRLRGEQLAAKNRLIETLEQREAVLDPDWTARFQLALASIALSSGAQREALILSARAINHYSKTGNLDREVDGLTIACSAAASLDHGDDLKSIIDRLDQLLPSLESQTRLLRARLARALTLSGSAASEERQEVFNASAMLGLTLIQLEAAHSIETAASTPAERDRWHREVNHLARQSGANLFLDTPSSR